MFISWLLFDITEVSCEDFKERTVSMLSVTYLFLLSYCHAKKMLKNAL